MSRIDVWMAIDAMPEGRAKEVARRLAPPRPRTMSMDALADAMRELYLPKIAKNFDADTPLLTILNTRSTHVRGRSFDLPIRVA